MRCSACRAAAPAGAVFCPDCGTAFYRLQWADPCAYVDANGYTETLLRVHVSGERLALDAIRRADGSALTTFSPQSQYWGTNLNLLVRLGPIYRYDPAAPLENLVCTARTEHGSVVHVPVPALRLSPVPKLCVRVDGVADPPAEAQPQPVRLRPSEGHRLWVELEFLNDAWAELREAHLESLGGERLKLEWTLIGTGGERVDPELLNPLTSRERRYALFLPPERLVPKGAADSAPATYRLSLSVWPREAPFEREIAPVFLQVPRVQLLVERPTRAGYAFLGRSAPSDPDLSPKRLVESEGLPELSAQVKQRLQLDPLVGETFEQIGRGEVVWRVPRGAPRTKRLVLAHTPGSGQEYDTLRYTVRLSLGGAEYELASFEHGAPADSRIELIVRLPPLEASAVGELVIEYRSGGEPPRDRYPVRVEVLPPISFPVPIAVDFGTTNSCVALEIPKREHGELKPLPVSPETVFLLPVGPLDERGMEMGVVPTRLGLRDGAYRFGRDADGSVFAEFKRYMSQPRIRSLDSAVERPPVELATEFLYELVRRATEFLEERGIEACLPERLTCSLPTAFAEGDRDRVMEAYAQALQRLGVPRAQQRLWRCDESMAAFLFERVSRLEQAAGRDDERHTLVMVYDFGGGTTDITVMLMEWDPEEQPRFVEIGAGGDAELGGKDVTSQLAVALFENTAPEALRLAERIKTSLGADLDDLSRQRSHEVAALLPGLEPPTADGGGQAEEIRRRIETARDAVTAWLEKRVTTVLDEVLDKVVARLEQVIGTVHGSIPLVVLLAGNASRLHGFSALTESVLKRWLENHLELALREVTLVSKPKACVAEGAYLSEGAAPDVEQPFSPHRSYWIKLPPLRRPDQSQHRALLRDGRWFVELVPEGDGAETERLFDPRTLGIAQGGEFALYRRQGTTFEEVKRWPLATPGRDQRLAVRVVADAVGVWLEWK